MTRLTGWLIAAVIPGGLIALIVRALYREYQAQQDEGRYMTQIQILMPGATKPRQVYAGFDPRLRERTAERRKEADENRKRAAKKESGTVELPMNNLRTFGARRERS